MQLRAIGLVEISAYIPIDGTGARSDTAILRDRFLDLTAPGKRKC